MAQVLWVYAPRPERLEASLSSSLSLSVVGVAVVSSWLLMLVERGGGDRSGSDVLDIGGRLVGGGKLVEHGCCLCGGCCGYKLSVVFQEGFAVDIGAMGLTHPVAGAVVIAGGGGVHGGLTMV